MTQYVETAKIFKALCDPTRVAIINLLREKDYCACELTKSLHVAQSKLSYHMKILCESGLVASWPVGKWTHYTINREGCLRAQDILQKLIQQDR